MTKEEKAGLDYIDGYNKGFDDGYNHAEKKLTLNWRDVPTLIGLTSKAVREFADNGRADVSLEELYTVVLGRFYEQK